VVTETRQSNRRWRILEVTTRRVRTGEVLPKQGGRLLCGRSTGGREREGGQRRGAKD
jgi:hypothetical protein